MSSSALAALQRALSPRNAWIFSIICILGDVVLTYIIVRFVPYTEIDWETYMAQVDLYINGERDYSHIFGPTGPLVYPAGHVYIHGLLYKLTEAGAAIPFAQRIYALLYIVYVSLAHCTYLSVGATPVWAMALLHASKRIHSIFVLRLFNDCWSVVLMQISILAMQRNATLLACIFFSAAVSVKMNALLYLPGILLIVFKLRGIAQLLLHLAVVAMVQILIGLPFLLQYAPSYLAGAFEFSRVFLYKWTVNWRFVPEALFLDTRFAGLLLLSHLAVLSVFALTKWCMRDGGAIPILRRGLVRPLEAPAPHFNRDDITTILFTCNLIGVLFARSLHYQFYSWYSFQIPFLLWRTPFPTPLRLVMAVLIEYAWNVYPSTVVSSLLLFLTHALLLVGLWFGFGNVPSSTLPSKKRKEA